MTQVPLFSICESRTVREICYRLQIVWQSGFCACQYIYMFFFVFFGIDSARDVLTSTDRLEIWYLCVCEYVCVYVCVCACNCVLWHAQIILPSTGCLKIRCFLIFGAFWLDSACDMHTLQRVCLFTHTNIPDFQNIPDCVCTLSHTHIQQRGCNMSRETRVWWSCWYLEDSVFDVCMIKFVINTPSHTHTHTTAGLAICSEGHMPGRNLPNSIYS